MNISSYGLAPPPVAVVNTPQAVNSTSVMVSWSPADNPVIGTVTGYQLTVVILRATDNTTHSNVTVDGGSTSRVLVSLGKQHWVYGCVLMQASVHTRCILIICYVLQTHLHMHTLGISMCNVIFRALTLTHIQTGAGPHKPTHCMQTTFMLFVSTHTCMHAQMQANTYCMSYTLDVTKCHYFYL